MKKFEYYRRNSNEANPIFEGDRQRQEGELTKIIRDPRGRETVPTTVAIIHLDIGEFVKELE
jgi:hypothetical protein